MFNLKRNFVYQYKAFLSTQSGRYKIESNQYFDVFIAGIIVLGVFVGFGVFFELLMNSHYVVLSTNISILGIFLLYRIKKETIFKKINDLHYKLIYGILYDLTFVVAVMSTIHVFLYLSLMFKVISLALLLITMLISIISILFYRLLRQSITLEHQFPYHELPFIILWVFLVIVILFFILPFTSITLTYIVSIVITVGVIAFKAWIQKYVQFYLESINAWASLVIIIVMILSIGGGVFNQVNFTPLTKMVFRENQVLHSIETLEDVNVTYELWENYLKVITDDAVYLLDSDFNKVVSVNKDDGKTVLVLDGIVHIVSKSDDQSGLDSSRHLDTRFDLYSLNEIGELEYVNSFVSTDKNLNHIYFMMINDTFYTYQLGYGNSIFDLEGNQYYIDQSYEEIGLIKGSQLLHSDMTSLIVYTETAHQSIPDLYFRELKVGLPFFNPITYYDDLVYEYEIRSGYCINDVQSLIEDNEKCKDTSYITEPGRIDAFYHVDDTYYLYKESPRYSDSPGNFVKLDKDFNEVENFEYGKALYYNGTHMWLLSRATEINNGQRYQVDTFYDVDMQNAHRYTYNNQEPFLRNALIFGWIGMISFTFHQSKPLFKPLLTAIKKQP